MSANPFTDIPAGSWELRFEQYDAEDEGRREALLALGNGVFVTRAAAIDSGRGETHYPGTYRAGCYNRLATVIAGHRDETESLVNLPNWLPLACRLPGEAWLRLDTICIRQYAHWLDMRSGCMHRDYVLQDRAGRQTAFRETRIVSMADPHCAALRLEVTPLDWSGELEVRSAIEGDVANANVERYADYANRHLDTFAHGRQDDCVYMQTRTSESRIAIAQAARTRVAVGTRQAACPEKALTEARSVGTLHRIAVKRGTTVVIEKLASACTALDGHDDPPQAALRIVAQASFSAWRDAHVCAWEDLWQRTGLEVAKQEFARPLRFHAFHILQTVSPHLAAIDAGIPARGWHGEGYHGHIFWDELFVFPFLVFRFPETAKACLMYRYRRLNAAREAAQEAGYRGAMYPWRSASDGREVTPAHQKNLISGGWMEDHTYLQRHVGAAVVYNIWHYVMTSGDDAFLADCGAEMMLEIARFWSSIAVPREDAGGFDGRFQICGVIGPDEYHNAYPWRDRPGLDNNAYTNVMAAWTLCRALELRECLPASRWQSLCRQLQIDNAELARWDLLSRRLFVPFHEGIINQYEGFEKLEKFDPAMLPSHMREQRVDWALRAIGRNADEFQITKQADALMLFYLLPKDEVAALFARLGYRCGDDCILRTARHYLARTEHRSSLSRVVYAGALAQVAPEMSWDFYKHVLDTDLDQLKGESVSEGIHLGAMGGSIDILQRRYLGIEVRRDGLSIDPCVPPQLGRVRLSLQYRGASILVAHMGDRMQLHAAAENPMPISVLFRGTRLRLSPGDTLHLDEMPLLANDGVAQALAQSN
jgi:trehalose/maltose hydrolase-like predicted phosphorylase